MAHGRMTHDATPLRLLGLGAAALLVALGSPATSAQKVERAGASTEKPAPEAPRFRVSRGTNVSHWLSQSDRRGEERRRFFTEEDVALVARLGFDHLRIPVDEEQLWDESGRPEEEAFALLDQALDWCAAYGLRAIVDLHILRSHHFNRGEKPLWTDPREQERFLEVWRQISARLDRRPVDQVAYELMNEPVAEDPEDWNRLVARAARVVRGREPERVLVIGSNRWQSADTFDRLRLPEGDRNILLSFHFYTPMPLTHYKAGWTKVGEYEGEVRYPGVVVSDDDLVGRPADLVSAIGGRNLHFDRTVLEERLAKPLALARQTGLPLYCGEWGALPSTPRADRLRWYADFRVVLEKYGIGWATWDYKGGFGIVDRQRTVDDGLVRILLGEGPPVEPIRSTQDLGLFEGESEVGGVSARGATVLDRGREEYRLTGSGANIWGTTDAFHFVWRKTAGDASLSARIRFVGEGRHEHRKAGLMLRGSLDADAPYVHATVHGDGLVSLQYREVKGGATREVKASLSSVRPSLLLARRGDVFTLLAGAPDTPLQQAASVRLALPAEAYVGLAVCSHEAGVLETAVFSDVAVTSPEDPPF